MSYPPKPQTGWNWTAELVRVKDADTVVLKLDLGFDDFGIRTIRLLGLNAHEHGTPDGDAATAWVKDWFTRHGVAVVVATEKRPDKWGGRYDGVIYAADGGACLNAEMIAAGQAFAWSGRGQKP